MDEVERTGEPVVITKNGKPVAELVPLWSSRPSPLGFLKERLFITGDIVSPLDVEWNTEVILLDTHVAIWVLRNDSALGRRTRDLVVAPSNQNQLAISAISSWEIALLISKRRLRSLDDPAETRKLILLTGVHEIPLTGEIAVLG
jgi:antitoxin (DNA-binding transcriptional repressor) of toxin-antitoxin stability system